MINFLKGFNVFPKEGKSILDLNQYFITYVEGKVKEKDFKFDENFVKELKTDLDISVKENIILKSKDNRDLRTTLLQTVQQLSLRKLEDYFDKKMNDDEYFMYFSIQKKSKQEAKPIIHSDAIPKGKKYIIRVEIFVGIIECDIRSNFTIMHSIKKFMLEHFASNEHFREVVLSNPQWNESVFESPVFLFENSASTFQQLRVLALIKIVFETIINKVIEQTNNSALKELDYGYIKYLIDSSIISELFYPLTLKPRLENMVEEETINRLSVETIGEICKNHNLEENDIEEIFEVIQSDERLSESCFFIFFEFYMLARSLITEEYFIALRDSLLAKMHKSTNDSCLFAGDTEIPKLFVDTLQKIIMDDEISIESMRILKDASQNEMLPGILRENLTNMLNDSDDSIQMWKMIRKINEEAQRAIEHTGRLELSSYRTYNLKSEILKFFGFDEIPHYSVEKPVRIFFEDFEGSLRDLPHFKVVEERFCQSVLAEDSDLPNTRIHCIVNNEQDNLSESYTHH